MLNDNFAKDMNDELNTITAPNGLKIIFYPLIHTEVSHCALMIKAGTRNEDYGKEGLAHFIEHMLFKGTKKRKAFHVLNRLEVIGGELNAFTSKEETCLHASILTPYLERALELISDIAFNSVFGLREIEKEKEVVCDEIRTYLDNPSEQIYDDFEGLVFKDDPLGFPILGTLDSVKSFKQKDLFRFTGQYYTISNMVLSVASSLEYSKLLNIINKYFGGYHSKAKSKQTPALTGKYKPQKSTVNKHNAQCHYIMGTVAPSLHHSNRTTMALLNNILGGPGMNSKLNLAIREKYGYTYSIESGYMAYSDAGLFHVYLATDKKYLEKSIHLVNAEMKKLRDKNIGTVQLHQYKQQLKGQLALARENKSNMTISNARSMIHFNRVISLNETFKRIDSISTKQLTEAANRYLNAQASNYSYLLYESIKHE